MAETLRRVTNNQNNFAIGEGLKASPGSFSFGDKMPLHFDQHIRKNIPAYENLMLWISRLSDWFLGVRTPLILDLGCATGEASFRIARRHGRRNGLEFLLIDIEEEMLTEAARKLEGLAKFRVEKGDVRKPFTEIQEASFAVMTFTLGFIPVEDKLDVLRNTRAVLRDGGGLVIAERVVGREPHSERMIQGLLEEEKLALSLTAEEIVGKNFAVRGQLTPLGLEDLAALTKEAGFERPELFWAVPGFVGLVCRPALSVLDKR